MLLPSLNIGPAYGVFVGIRVGRGVLVGARVGVLVGNGADVWVGAFDATNTSVAGAGVVC